MFNLHSKAFPVLTAWDGLKHPETIAPRGGSYPSVVVVVDRLSGFSWDKCSKSDKRGVWCWVGCKGNNIIELICTAPQGSKALD